MFSMWLTQAINPNKDAAVACSDKSELIRPGISFVISDRQWLAAAQGLLVWHFSWSLVGRRFWAWQRLPFVRRKIDDFRVGRTTAAGEQPSPPRQQPTTG